MSLFSAFKAATALILVTALTACGGGGSDGPATVVNQVSSNTATANAYTGPAAATADVTSFQINLWQNIREIGRAHV